MSLETIRHLALKIKSHCEKWDIREVYFAFHGGEPLLAKKEFYRSAISLINHTLGGGIEPIYTIQTNGTLLDKEWCQLFDELNVKIGVSIDGPEKFNDEFRVYHNNKGSFDDVMLGIQSLKEGEKFGLISVVNTNIEPQELYSLFKTTKVRTVNLLLPDTHHDLIENLPSDELTFGKWLIELYECWKSDDIASRPKITFFDTIISILMGNIKGDEVLGKVKCGIVVIETDGAIEVTDPLRICGNGFTRNSLNVKRSEIDDIFELPLFGVYYNSHDNLCEQCQKCPIQNICGGGYLAHRYSAKNGFENPSVYCKDLIKIITHIQNDFCNSLPESILEKLEMGPIHYEEIVESFKL